MVVSRPIFNCFVSTEEVPHGGVLSYASGGGGVHSNAWEEGLAKARQLRKIRCLVCFLSGFVCLFVCLFLFIGIL